MARVADWALGLTVFGWVVRDVLTTRAGSAVGAAVASVNLVVALLFVVRRQPERSAGPGRSALCLLSALSSGAMLALAPAPELWPAAPRTIFVGGAALAACSLLVLGRSFGVLPALRGLVRAGPYRLVRHPIYLGELGMVLGCALAASSVASWATAALGLVLCAARVVVEEQLLGESADYRAYQAEVRFRLLPGVW